MFPCYKMPIANTVWCAGIILFVYVSCDYVCKDGPLNGLSETMELNFPPREVRLKNYPKGDFHWE